ncbi:uncharacterized protein LOC142318193 [Lycorma delicatula]|uniref:uncharacterized protein LOC142318193 n=1 Tax=Lycorma delicatula TaxID=130591 RepID=UPI003F50F262
MEMEADTISVYMKEKINEGNEEESDLALKNSYSVSMGGDKSLSLLYNTDIDSEVGKCWESFKLDSWKTAKRKKLDEKLIELVRAQPIIYDTGHPQFPDVDYKEKIWANIGEKLNEPGSVCKARWINIRDFYQKSRSCSTMSGCEGSTKSMFDGCPKKKSKHIPSLSFLDDYLDERINSSPRLEENPTPDESMHPEQLIEDLEAHGDCYGQSEFRSSPNTYLLVDKVDQKKFSNTGSKKKYDNSQEATVCAIIIKYLLEEKRRRSQLQLTVDPMDTFLSSIRTTLKTFPPYHAHLAKGEIFNIVQKYERQIIVDKVHQQEQRQSFLPSTSSYVNKTMSGSPALPYQSNSYSSGVCPSLSILNSQSPDLLNSNLMHFNIQAPLSQEISKNEIETRRSRNINPHYSTKTAEKEHK